MLVSHATYAVLKITFGSWSVIHSKYEHRITDFPIGMYSKMSYQIGLCFVICDWACENQPSGRIKIALFFEL